MATGSHKPMPRYCANLRFGVSEPTHDQEVAGLEGCLDYIQRLQDARNSLGYDIDGIVIKVNQLALQENSVTSPANRAGRSL